MITRLRLAALAAVILVGSSGLVAAAVIAPGDHVQAPAPVERVHRFYAAGPSALYGSDFGSIGVVRPLVWQVPGTDPRTGVAEVSFQYRTRGPGPFVITLGVREAGGARSTVRPDQLVLASAPDGASTTVRFLVPDLAGGATYRATVGVNSTSPDRGHTNKITTSKVLVTVDLE